MQKSAQAIARPLPPLVRSQGVMTRPALKATSRAVGGTCHRQSPRHGLLANSMSDRRGLKG